MNGTNYVKSLGGALVLSFLALFLTKTFSVTQSHAAVSADSACKASVGSTNPQFRRAVDSNAGLNVDQCGAYGDNNIHDDTAAFNAALTTSRHVICSTKKIYGIRGIITITNPGTTLDLTGCILKLAETPSTNHFLRITADNTTVNDLHLTGIGDGIYVGDGATNTTINRYDCDSALVPSGLSECIYLGTANRVVVDQFRMTSTGYGVLQQTGRPVHTIRISRAVANDMYGDFFEQNGTETGPMSDVTLSQITFNGCHGFPIPTTECRFVGTTSVQGLTITDSSARNVTGDACLHFEGTSAHILMSNTVLVDCQVSGGNDGYIYFLTSSADFRSVHNTFIKTAKLAGAIYAFSTQSGSYANPIASTNDVFIDQSGTHSFGGFNLAFHNGIVKIDNPVAKDIGTFISIVSTTGVSWTGGTITNATNGILAENGGRPSGGGGTNISVKGVHLDCITWCARSSTNTNGTGPPTNWTLVGNVYTGSGRVLLDDRR